MKDENEATQEQAFPPIGAILIRERQHDAPQLGVFGYTEHMAPVVFTFGAVSIYTPAQWQPVDEFIKPLIKQAFGVSELK